MDTQERVHAHLYHSTIITVCACREQYVKAIRQVRSGGEGAGARGMDRMLWRNTPVALAMRGELSRCAAGVGASLFTFAATSAGVLGPAVLWAPSAWEYSDKIVSQSLPLSPASIESAPITCEVTGNPAAARFSRDMS